MVVLLFKQLSLFGYSQRICPGGAKKNKKNNKNYRTQIPKFHFEMLLFNLAQGLRKCWQLPKKKIVLVFLRFLEPAPGGMYVFFDFF